AHLNLFLFFLTFTCTAHSHRTKLVIERKSDTCEACTDTRRSSCYGYCYPVKIEGPLWGQVCLVNLMPTQSSKHSYSSLHWALRKPVQLSSLITCQTFFLLVVLNIQNQLNLRPSVDYYEKYPLYSRNTLHSFIPHGASPIRKEIYVTVNRDHL